MSKQFQNLQRRFGSARPGLDLLAIEVAALPVTVLNADVLAQEKKELPITEEFALQFVRLGVDTPGEIASFLGLELDHIVDAVAVHLRGNYLRRGAPADKIDSQPLKLTAQGMEVARTLQAVQPVLKRLPVTFDRLTWSHADYSDYALISKKEAQNEGMIILPSQRNANIGTHDITPAGFNALLKSERSNRIQILRVQDVSVKKHRYLPVQLLVYGNGSAGELELAVCVEDELSDAHGLALDSVDAIKRLEISVGKPEPRPLLEKDLEEQRVSSGGEEENGEPGGGPSGQSDLTAMVRGISVFEHVDILAEALSEAKSRLLIISPWIKKAVVTTEFLAKLERRLRAKVEVTVAHGYGKDDDGSDEIAINRLGNLAHRFPENFTFVRLKNTHAKILIFDDHWISTSFNWLSFKGDSDRTYRMEEGTVVTIPDRVDKEYRRYRALIKDQQR